MIRSASMAVLLSALMLTACTVGPDYKAPALDLPGWWHSLGQKKARPAPLVKSTVSTNWWTNFQDPPLNTLVTRALKNNHDLKIATARIAEARGSYQATASSAYPQLSASARDQNSRQILFGNQSLDIHQYTAVFDASWEIDLFGGTRRATEAATDIVQAREADLRAATITLIGDVARNYIEWRELQQNIALTQQTVKAQKTLLDITNQQYTAGTGSYLATSQAQTLYQNTQAILPELERQRDGAGYRLSVLLGEPAGALNDTLKPVKAMPKPIALPTLAAPAEIIRNRPDVQAAERQLAATTALQGVAFSNLFPRLSLSGFFGINGASLGKPTETWGITPTAAIPLLNFGNLQGNIKVADARQAQAFHAYRNTVLKAVSDVETSLTNVEKSRQRVALLQKATSSAKQSVSIARDRYTNGLSNFTDVLAAEQSLYGTQSDLVRAQGDVLLYLTSLHKALAIAPVATQQSSQGHTDQGK